MVSGSSRCVPRASCPRTWLDASRSKVSQVAGAGISLPARNRSSEGGANPKIGPLWMPSLREESSRVPPPRTRGRSGAKRRGRGSMIRYVSEVRDGRLVGRAKALRRRRSFPEVLLWGRIRPVVCQGFRFRRQHRFGLDSWWISTVASPTLRSRWTAAPGSDRAGRRQVRADPGAVGPSGS